jgi:hypothetical protein
MKKIALVALAALTVFSTVAVSTKDAEARRWGRGAAIGLGIVTAGAIIAGATGPRYTRECGWVSRYNAYGEYRGERRVCRTVAY